MLDDIRKPKAERREWIVEILKDMDGKHTGFLHMGELVRCKDCKHNPKYTGDYMYGRCVFCCEDDFYSETPSDDFYCGFGAMMKGADDE